MDNIVIFNPYALWDFHLNFEIPIYHNLKSRGYNPIYLRCGIAHDECDLYWKAAIGVRPENACANCMRATDQYFKGGGIHYESLGDHFDSAQMYEVKIAIKEMEFDHLQSLELFNIKLFETAVSSVYTHLRINRLDPLNVEHLTVLKDYILLAMTAVVAGAVFLDKYKPKVALIFNGRMAPTRAFMQLCKNRGVRVCTHERGITNGGMFLIEEDYCLSERPLQKIGERFVSHPLKSYQVSMVREWLIGRINGKNISWKNFQTTPGAPSVRSLQGGTKVKWVLFTSSTDELACSPEIFYSNFENQYEWVEATCRYAAEHSDAIDLIIRVHPNSGSKTSTGINSEEMRFFQNLKSKYDPIIKVNLSNDEVNSYDLIRDADFIMCYASTIALESLLMGRKTYLAANCPYIHCSGLLNFKTNPVYSKVLEYHSARGNCQISDKNLVIGYRFVYHWLFNDQVNFPFLNQLSPHLNRLEVKSVGEFGIGMHLELDRAVEVILGLREVALPPFGYFGQSDLDNEINSINAPYQEDNPLFSVVITNYNYGFYLEGCVESVVNQDIKDDLEIVIVDDGSTDDSLEKIKSILEKYCDYNIVTLFQENSGQPAISRNNGIKVAKGKFILPLDADDMIASGYLFNCKKILTERPNVNLVYANMYEVTPQATTFHKPSVFSAGMLAVANRIFIASVFSKNLWERVGGYRENVRGYEDWDLWLNMSLNGAISAYYDGVGMLYNLKETGLYNQVKGQHESLYAKIILNNRRAYKYNQQLIDWAGMVLGR